MKTNKSPIFFEYFLLFFFLIKRTILQNHILKLWTWGI